MRKIAASILGKENKKDLINLLIDRGIDSIHYDVMDGKFVDNTSLPTEEVLELFATTNEHYKDVHLMVNDPTDYLSNLIEKADQISIHWESLDKEETIKLLEKYKDTNKLGIVVNPSTNIEEIFGVLQFLNHVMIMSVVPGKGGQTFIEDSLEKITKLKSEIEKINKNIIIEIDGGINDIWGPVVFEKGVNLAVSGSYLINNIDDDSINKILGK